jgi:phosphoribosylformylglycinamidine cyclo-ligase
LAESGQVSEMRKVFNCGIGMVLVVTEGDVAAAKMLLQDQGETVIEIGKIAK